MASSSSSSSAPPPVVQRSSLAVGDLIYASVIINKADFIGTKGTGTAKAIKKGSPLERICVVLASSATSVTVTYIASFTLVGTATPYPLPGGLDATMWYPAQPAGAIGDLTPIPNILDNGKATWVSLREKQIVSAGTVKKLPQTVPLASVNIISAAMKA